MRQKFEDEFFRQNNQRAKLVSRDYLFDLNDK
jgi:hypothetical protein